MIVVHYVVLVFLSNTSLFVLMAISTMHGVLLYGSKRTQCNLCGGLVHPNWYKNFGFVEFWQLFGKQVCGFGMWACTVYDNKTKESYCFKWSPNYWLVIFPSHICSCWWTLMHWLVYWVITLKLSKYCIFFTLIIPLCRYIVVVSLAVWCCSVIWLVLIIVNFERSRIFSVHWALV